RGRGGRRRRPGWRGAGARPPRGSRRPSARLREGGLAGPGAPVVELLPELEVEEALGRDDAVERANAVRQVEQLAAVGADELDEDVELAGGDDHVAGFFPAGDLVRDRLGRPGGADADHRLRVEAEPERVRDGRDLEDVVIAEAGVARADRRLGDADPLRDPPERLASVLLQRLDAALVDPVLVS